MESREQPGAGWCLPDCGRQTTPTTSVTQAGSSSFSTSSLSSRSRSSPASSSSTPRRRPAPLRRPSSCRCSSPGRASRSTRTGSTPTTCFSAAGALRRDARDRRARGADRECRQRCEHRLRRLYIALRSILLALYARAWRAVPPARPLIARDGPGYAVAVGLWVVSLALPSPARYVLWAIALALDLSLPPLSTRLIRRVPTHGGHGRRALGALHADRPRRSRSSLSRSAWPDRTGRWKLRDRGGRRLRRRRGPLVALLRPVARGRRIRGGAPRDRRLLVRPSAAADGPRGDGCRARARRSSTRTTNTWEPARAPPTSAAPPSSCSRSSSCVRRRRRPAGCVRLRAEARRGGRPRRARGTAVTAADPGRRRGAGGRPHDAARARSSRRGGDSEELREPQRVPGRKAFPVVVEVDEHLADGPRAQIRSAQSRARDSE